MSSAMQAESSADSLNLLVDAPLVRQADLKNDGYPDGLSSVGKRAIALVRFLITFCIGVAATLAWQSYGDLIARSYPPLNWLAPQVEPVPQNAPDAIRPALRTASSPDQQQPSAISLDLDAVGQDTDRIPSSHEQMTSNADRIVTSQEQMIRSLDRIARSQEQMMRSLDQFTADQEQTAGGITKLREIEQSNSARNSEPSPLPDSASAPMPVPRPASASAPPIPVSRSPSGSAPMPVPRPVSASAPVPIPRPSSAPAPKPLSQASRASTLP
jgi:hypothetical protein